MAHVEVVRRSLSLRQWSEITFKRIDQLIIKQAFCTSGWQARHGDYHVDGYDWKDEWQPIAKSDRWGGPDTATVFKAVVTIPEELAGKEVYFQMLTSCEVLVKGNGKWLDGLDPNRQRLLLSKKAKAGESIDITMEAYIRSKPDDERNP